MSKHMSDTDTVAQHSKCSGITIRCPRNSTLVEIDPVYCGIADACLEAATPLGVSVVLRVYSHV